MLTALEFVPFGKFGGCKEACLYWDQCPKVGPSFVPIAERCIPWRFRASPRQIAISQIALSAGKQWTSGIQASFRSTSSFIGLKMPNRLRWAAANKRSARPLTAGLRTLACVCDRKHRIRAAVGYRLRSAGPSLLRPSRQNASFQNGNWKPMLSGLLLRGRRGRCGRRL